MDQKNPKSLISQSTPDSVADCFQVEEKSCLIKKIKSQLGGGIVKIEITNEDWCNLMEIAVEDYIEEIQKWLISNQWSSIYGKDITKTDLCFALTQRSLDYEQNFANAFSKQAGYQTNGNWELKKDFVTIEEGRQVYEIPAGRQINEVLWLTPSDIDHATFSSLGYGNVAGGNFGSNTGLGFAGAGNLGGYSSGSYYIAPAYDIFLRANDYGLKNRIMQSDLTYKVTAGANGTRLLHLFSIPNNGNTIGIRRELYGKRVWYYYYDTGTDDPTDCLNECSDVIKYPSDIPLPETDYCSLNYNSKIWVRKYLTALAKEVLGRTRGKWSGKLAVPEAEIKMDYESLLAEGKEEKKNLKEELVKFLEELRSDKQLERKAKEAKDLNEILSYNPMGLWWK